MQQKIKYLYPSTSRDTWEEEQRGNLEQGGNLFPYSFL